MRWLAFTVLLLPSLARAEAVVVCEGTDTTLLMAEGFTIGSGVNSNPGVVQATVVDKRRITLTGKNPGKATYVIFDAGDRARRIEYEVRVRPIDECRDRMKARAMGPRGGGGEKREKMIKVIEAVRIAKLTEALELDSETAEKLFPAIRPFNERRAEAGRKRMEAMRALRDEMDSEKPDSDRVGDLLDSFAAAQREHAKTQEEEYEALKKILDPLTLARYYRFQMEFEREVKGILKDFKGEKQNRMRGHP